MLHLEIFVLVRWAFLWSWKHIKRATYVLKHMEIFYHHHQILLRLVEHRASMKSFQALRSPAIPLPSFHDFLYFSSHPLLSFTTFSSAYLSSYIPDVFSVAPVSLCNVCPIQFHFLLFIWFSIDFWWVILHSSSFVILSVHFTFIIRLKHLFINICSLLVIWLVVFQVSQAYNNTDFTCVLNIRILTSFDMLRFLHTGYSWTNTQMVLNYSNFIFWRRGGLLKQVFLYLEHIWL